MRIKKVDVAGRGGNGCYGSLGRNRALQPIRKNDREKSDVARQIDGPRTFRLTITLTGSYVSVIPCRACLILGGIS